MAETTAGASGNGATPPTESNTLELITKLYERRAKIRTVVICAIDENGKSTAEFTSPMNPPVLSHLLRTANVKLDRYYSSAMFPQSPQIGPPGGVRKSPVQEQVPRHVRRMVEKAQKKINKRRPPGP